MRLLFQLFAFYGLVISYVYTTPTGVSIFAANIGMFIIYW